LSAGALAALQEFYSEKDARQQRFEDMKAKAEADFDDQNELSMADFAEDWNTSQFWVPARPGSISRTMEIDIKAQPVRRSYCEGAGPTTPYWCNRRQCHCCRISPERIHTAKEFD
jgi:hypothetical protein